jgi:hypothetical protein
MRVDGLMRELQFSLAFHRKISSTLINFELLQTSMRVDEMLVRPVTNINDWSALILVQRGLYVRKFAPFSAPKWFKLSHVIAKS